MNSSAATLQLPNPHTPMAFLTPSQAEEYQVSTYIYFASVGAFVWDWLMAMPDEYKILRKGGISMSKIVYFCARVSSLSFCLTSTMFQVASVYNCQALMYAIGALTSLSLLFNNLLFFIRVRAVYGNSKLVTAFFGFWYLTVFGTSLCVPFALGAAHIGPTKRCVDTDVRPWVVSVILSNAINGTLVFLAISYRIASQSMGGEGRRSTAMSFFSGDGAPRVAKELLHGGQLCYFATIMMGIIQAILAFGSRYQATLNIPGVALENAMTCRVHRAVILGLITDGPRRSAPFVFTTVVSGTTVSDDMALKDYDLDTKNDFRHRRELSNVTPSVQQVESITDRV